MNQKSALKEESHSQTLFGSLYVTRTDKSRGRKWLRADYGRREMRPCLRQALGFWSHSRASGGLRGGTWGKRDNPETPWSWIYSKFSSRHWLLKLCADSTSQAGSSEEASSLLFSPQILDLWARKQKSFWRNQKGTFLWFWNRKQFFLFACFFFFSFCLWQDQAGLKFTMYLRMDLISLSLHLPPPEFWD